MPTYPYKSWYESRNSINPLPTVLFDNEEFLCLVLTSMKLMTVKHVRVTCNIVDKRHPNHGLDYIKITVDISPHPLLRE